MTAETVLCTGALSPVFSLNIHSSLGFPKKKGEHLHETSDSTDDGKEIILIRAGVAVPTKHITQSVIVIEN